MKTITLSLLAFMLLFSSAVFAQSEAAKADDKKGAKIKFNEESKNFGDIKQGEVVKHVFTFKNNGSEPLILSNVLTTCGCTASNWSKDPIMPGKTGTVEASFNSAGKMGQQNKVLTIQSNSQEGDARISVICNVLPAAN